MVHNHQLPIDRALNEMQQFLQVFQVFMPLPLLNTRTRRLEVELRVGRH